MPTLAQILDEYPSEFAPLAEVARHYARFPSRVTDDGTLYIGHRPWVARLNYMITLYPGVSVESLDKYGQRFSIQIPSVYCRLLNFVNGCFCFGMSLCGIPRSMLNDPPLLDRTSLQCHDLATAAKSWATEYSVPASYFHFGGRHFSHTENIGYFIVGEKKIVSVRKEGKSVAEWDSFANFLADELKSSERLEEEMHPPV